MSFLDETGLTHLWGKITNKFLAKSNVANNLTTTSEGYALDARQGVALMNAISESNMRLVPEILINKKFGYDSGTNAEADNIDKTYTFEHNCILYIALDFPENGSNGDMVSIYVAGVEHTIYTGNYSSTSKFDSPLSVNYKAFIPAGTTVRLKRDVRGSEHYAGILATVLYIE